MKRLSIRLRSLVETAISEMQLPSLIVGGSDDRSYETCGRTVLFPHVVQRNTAKALLLRDPSREVSSYAVHM